MSNSEKNVEELKSLVVHTLETNGVLGQIRAHLRANVYKAIDCEEEQGNAVQRPMSKLMKSPLGQLMAEIVAEFFEFYGFRHSLSVFLPECNLGRDRRSRTEVASDAGLGRVLPEVSILEQIIGLATGPDLRKSGEDWHSSASSTTASSPPPASTLGAASGVSKASVDEVREDMLRLQQIDKQIARLNRSAAAAGGAAGGGAAPSTTEPGEGNSTQGIVAEDPEALGAVDHSSSLSGSQAESSAGPAPPRSLPRSPDQSSNGSLPASPAASNASLHSVDAGSDAAPEVVASLHSADSDGGMAAEAGGTRGGNPEESGELGEHSISVDDSVGSGSIELGGTKTRGGSSLLPRGGAPGNADELEEEESIAEDFSGGESIEGYQSSDANQSSNERF